MWQPIPILNIAVRVRAFLGRKKRFQGFFIKTNHRSASVFANVATSSNS
jgi:hypothetical protein